MKKMGAMEFMNLGYLQEVNRQFLHPLGLALEVVIEATGEMRFGSVWDCRDDPEGIMFDKFDEVSLLKAEMVRSDQSSKAITREALLGFVIQPLLPRESKNGR